MGSAEAERDEGAADDPLGKSSYQCCRCSNASGKNFRIPKALFANEFSIVLEVHAN